jgi:D-threo-aldose 1-dehydrogenase
VSSPNDRPPESSQSDRPPEIALGCAPLAGLYEEVDEEQAAATVLAALGSGVTLFDTAPLYGHGLSELRLGRALAGVPRTSYTLQTQGGRVLVPGEEASIFAGTPPVHPVFDFSRDGVLRSLDESLARLGVDRVDHLLIHDPYDFMDQAIGEAWPALSELRGAGVVDRIGVGVNESAVAARFARETDVDVFLIAGELTLLDDAALEELVPAASGRTVLAAGVFNSGVLAGGETFFYGEVPAWVRDKVAALTRVCERHEVPLAAVALQYPLRHVETIVVGARSPGEVRENRRLAHLPIPTELWQDLGSAGLVRSW